MLGQAAVRATGGSRRALLLARELPATHWNLTSASSRKWVSKSQRKKRSRLRGGGGEEEHLREGEPQSNEGCTQQVHAFPCPRWARPSGPYNARAAPSATRDHRSMGARLLDGQDCCSWGYTDT